MNQKILIIDDDSANRRLFHDLLEIKGFKTVGASSGEEGIDKVKKENPDLILMDIMMPGMDGYQTTQIIKKKINCNIPIIAVTASAMKGDDKKALDAGCDGYISKPINIESFIDMIKKFLKTYQKDLRANNTE